MPKDITLSIGAGSPLMTAPTISLENIPEGGFSQLTNWRREEDQLVRREGWVKFAPVSGVSSTTQFTYDAAEDIQRLAEVVRPNGERVLVGCSQTLIKRFNRTLGVWQTIGSGFSASGKRWQVVTSINGYMVLNNTVDLPVVFRAEWPSVLPIYELREVGVACVGRICDYNGFLFVGDITEIKADQLNAWMNGATPYGIVTPAEILNRLPWAVAWSEYGEPRGWAPLFNVTMSAASTTITLPFQSAVFAPLRTQFGANGFAYGATVFDGSYIWSIETDANQISLWRTQPATGAMTEFPVTGYTTVDSFRGLAFDGTNLWLSPYAANAVVKYNIAANTFTSYAHGYGANAFWGAVFDGTSVWLVPFDSASFVKVNITTGAFTNVANTYGTSAFRGATTDGTYIYFAPYNATDFVRITKATSALTVIGAKPVVAGGFSDAAFDGTYVWFAPYNSTVIVKIKPDGTGQANYTHGYGTTAFGTIVFDGTNMWLIPYNPSLLSGYARVKTTDGTLTRFYTTTGIRASFGAFDGLRIWYGDWAGVTNMWSVTLPRVGPTSDTRVGVINAGVDGGVLGGQTNYENGIKVTVANNATASNIVLELTTNVSLTYPRVVGVTRWTDISTIVGRALLQGDGSEIVGMQKLGLLLIIYRTGGIYTGRFTGVAAEPFQFRPRYDGRDVPMFGDAIVNVRGEYHLYPSINGRFMTFDGLTNPKEQDLCSNARDAFFSGILITDTCWAVELPLTNEVIFISPTQMMAFCYEAHNPGVTQIDSVWYAACSCRKPASTPDWFVIGIGRFVYQYSFENGAGTGWLRDGVVPVPVAKSGLMAFRDQNNEKTLQQITPLLSSPSPDMAMTVTLRGTYNPSAALTTFLNAEALPTPQGENYIPCLYQAIYLQDEIRVTDTRDLNARFSGRLFTFESVKALGVTRTNR